ncbi:uncharacterized protein [Ptychodera flava]|uniref:uncharacterized protein n=1 Tax=Ptychodera flava TaxID=63121 RepID=UPI00396A0611
MGLLAPRFLHHQTTMLLFAVLTPYFLTLLVCPRPASGSFGDDISNDNADNRFAEMGQVYKETFNVTMGQVDIELVVQDTGGVQEIWILDFQPFRFIQNALPVDEATGRLDMSRTGECSSVYEDSEFPTYLQDNYFANKTSGELTTKKLFTSFVRDNTLDSNNYRNHKIVYSGDLETFFECKKSDGLTSIWDVTSDTQDEIEYRTKLYATNVRPKDLSSASAGMSFVQSHIELIWRLSRTAIGKFIISSTAILQPIFEFAIVGTVYDENDQPVPTQANLHIRFTTVLDTDKQMVVYAADSIVYIPDNENHAINKTVLAPPSTLANTTVCTIALDEGTGSQLQCRQTFDFKFVLEIDTSLATNSEPVDASGVFEFFFNTYTCETVNNQTQVGTCVLNSDQGLVKVSAAVTLQTTVLLEDAEDDQITITLVSLRGVNNVEFSVPGNRGVLHKEEVTLEVKFSPALLREDFTLELLLFMVCRGEEYAGEERPDGCLESPKRGRYVAHLDNAFQLPSAHGNDTFNSTHLEGDFQQPLESHVYKQLAENGAVLAVPIHQSVFINKALSGKSDTYTITTVYRLKSKTRKRRDLLEEEETIQDVVLHHAVRDNKIVHTRRARAIEDSVEKHHDKVVAFQAAGCPSNAIHDGDEFECICPKWTYLNQDLYQCEASIFKDLPVGSSDIISSSIISICSTVILVFVLV